eukprot:SAG31_NODE_4172_length_3511_cov_1.676143_3_plen_109_part_00
MSRLPTARRGEFDDLDDDDDDGTQFEITTIEGEVDGSLDSVDGSFTGEGEGCYFLVFVQLFEKYGTIIERNTALIEKVSPCRCSASRPCRRFAGGEGDARFGVGKDAC